jgi:RNA polymerase sigma-70 factor (ECF subfamily)
LERKQRGSGYHHSTGFPFVNPGDPLLTTRPYSAILLRAAQPTGPGGVLIIGTAGLVTRWEEQVTSTDSDSELVARAKEDPTAFGALYERYVTKIYNYIYYRVGNHHDAEDLTSRTFFRALRHIGNYEDRGAPVSAWFYRIAHNLVVNWHRDQGRRPVVALEAVSVDDSPGSPETLVAKTEEQKRLLDVVRRLPEDRQRLLVLKFTGRLSNAEIGAVMERTEGAIKSLYHRTLIALRQELVVPEGQGEENPDG